MEALFSTTLASYEAWLMVLCVIVFFGIYLFDGIAFVQRVYSALRPAQIKKDTALIVGEAGVSEVTSPLLEPIAPEEVEAHEAEKAKAEEKHEQEVMESEVFEEKVLEEIQQAEEAEKAEEVETMEMTEKIEQIEEKKEEEKNSETEESAPVISTESSVPVTTTRYPAQEIETEESEEVIENDLEEKEKIEEELLDVEKVETTDGLEDQETIEEKNEEEAIIKEDAIEIESEIQEEAEEVEHGETIEKPKETEEETSSIVTEDTRVEGEPQDTEAKEEVVTQDTALATEDVQSLPITASIPEPAPEVRKSTESQYAERLYAMTNEVKTLIARGHPQDARALIIQGLALDKNHRELNLILGSIYESERQAQKAEYIYKDLALIYPEDGEILERLANILIIEKRYDIALEIYKKIISLSSETEGSLYIMTHLAHELGHNEELYAYARRYQKNWPNNPDILTLLAQAEIALGERQAAIQTLIKLKNLTPYNNEIMETIAKLTMEEELAGNFGGEKI